MAGKGKGNMLRPDGTRKGRGWLGPRARPDGRVSTEISTTVGLDGRETLIPLMVPGLTEEELGYLLTNNERSPQFMQNMPRSIEDKAVAHAVNLLRQGKSPFAPEKTPPSFPPKPQATRLPTSSGKSSARYGSACSLPACRVGRRRHPAHGFRPWRTMRLQGLWGRLAGYSNPAGSLRRRTGCLPC